MSERYRVLFALFAGTGLRAGEMLALKAEDLSHDCRVLLIQRAIWHGRIQTPKTGNAIRTVDIPNALASLLRVYVAGKTGFLFTTKAGRPLNQRNVLRTLHAVAGKTGFHAFRRFRTSILRKAGTPEDLIKLWLGHAGRSVTDDYARQLRDDIPFRQEWAERVGLGFELGYVGLRNETPIAFSQAA